jgi:hypothetical protein
VGSTGVGAVEGDAPVPFPIGTGLPTPTMTRLRVGPEVGELADADWALGAGDGLGTVDGEDAEGPPALGVCDAPFGTTTTAVPFGCVGEPNAEVPDAT